MEHYSKNLHLMTDETDRYRIVTAKLSPGIWETMLFHNGLYNDRFPIAEKRSGTYEEAIACHAEAWFAAYNSEERR